MSLYEGYIIIAFLGSVVVAFLIGFASGMDVVISDIEKDGVFGLGKRRIVGKVEERKVKS